MRVEITKLTDDMASYDDTERVEAETRCGQPAGGR